MSDIVLQTKAPIIPLETFAQKIFLVRGQKVMLDIDIAQLYGVSTKVLNQTVKRNKERFPTDFMFQLNKLEKEQVVINCDHLSMLKFSYQLPYAFTEHGVAMLSSVLRSKKAIEINILIIRAFIKIREILASNKEMAYKIEELECEQKVQNKHINAIYFLIQKLIEPPVKEIKSIGFTKA
ncbi:MAG: ORF6N domain-containing protein [Candidatus Paceibacterota bacterium]|jgi:phage regulator Rha-like protein